MIQNNYPLHRASQFTDEQFIRFLCPVCTKRLKAPLNAGGRAGNCPKCTTGLVIPPLALPDLTPPIPVYATSPAASSPSPEPTVPLKITFPQTGGSVQTQVTQKTADSTVMAVVGGSLVAVGVLLTAYFFGTKPPRMT